MTKDSRRELEVDHRVILQLAQGTIKGPFQAIVELVTNSEDSYIRMGNFGDLGIFVKSVPGRGDVLGVVDSAEGMDRGQLDAAIVFGKRGSGQKQGSGIRGYFGRGLKESILGLGEGEVFSVRNGILSHVRIFVVGGKALGTCKR